MSMITLSKFIAKLKHWKGDLRKPLKTRDELISISVIWTDLTVCKKFKYIHKNIKLNGIIKHIVYLSNKTIKKKNKKELIRESYNDGIVVAGTKYAVLHLCILNYLLEWKVAMILVSTRVWVEIYVPYYPE